MNSRAILITAATAFLAACADHPTQPVSPPAPDASLASAANGAGRPVHVEDRFTIQPRFRQQVSVSGSLKPGHPIQLHVKTEALLATGEVEVRLVLPEAELARWNGRKNGGGALRGRVPAAGEWRGGMGRGAVIQRNAQVVIPAPGYYRAVLTTRAVSDEPETVDGSATAQVSVRTIWLLVDSAGGRVTDRFEPSLLPAGAEPVAGPFRFTSAGRDPSTSGIRSVSESTLVPGMTELQPVDDGTGGGGGGGTYTPPPAPATRRYRLVYYHARTGELLPVRRATLWYDLTRITATDDDGYATVSCPAGSITAFLENSYIEMDAKIEMPNICGRAQVPGEAEHVFFSTLGDEFAHVFSQMTTSAVRGAQFFGRTRGQLHVSMSLSASNNHYQDGEGMFDGSEKVVIRAIADDGFYVWDRWGTFIQGHEYGHAFHHRALGGLPDDPGEGCQEHHDYSDESTQCAWQEGLADYYSVATLTDEGGRYGYYNDGWPLTQARSQGYTDGERIEGAVASWLLHVGGTHNTYAAWPGANGIYLGTLIRTCSGKAAGLFWEHVWRAGVLAYCMENQVDPWVTQNYFRTGIPATAQSHSAATPYGWTTAEARRRWLYDLYRQ